ncbi:MAG: hypothetical protein AB7O96_05155 [Pseudobdellovibrionaceae bacterium]
MKQILLFSALLLATSISNAQTFKVKKAKGKQAIIEMSAPGAFSVGESYTVGGESGGDESSGEMMTGPGGRTRTIAGQFGFSNISVDGGEATTALDFRGKYGWNLGQYEGGPSASYFMSSNAGTQLTRFGVGGFFDYNFGTNKNVSSIYGLGADFQYKSEQPDGGDAVSWNEMLVGAFGKYFALGTPTAIRFDLAYQYYKYERVTKSGFVILGGLQTYF